MYKLERYNKKNNKMFRRTIIILSLILIILIAYIYIQTHKQPARPLFNTEKAKQEQIVYNNKVQDWSIIEEAFANECKKQNEMIVLEGKRTIKKVYSTTDDEITYKTGNPMGFLFDKLNQWSTRYISITTAYNYIFSYDLNDIDIAIDENGTANIKLYRGDVHLKPIAEIPTDRILETEEGWLSKKFNASELNAIMTRTQLHTYNNIINDNDLYEKALDSAKENLQELALKLGVKAVNVEILNVAALGNNEVAVIEDSQLNK